MRAKTIILIILVSLLSALALPVGTASAEGNAEVGLTLTIALTISDVSASNIADSSAAINWKTNGNATSQVFYDTVYHDNITGYAYQTTEAPSLVSTHSTTLTGLSSATTYHYRAKSVLICDGTEFIAISDDYTFTTLSPPAGGGGGALPPTPPPTPPPPSGTTPVSDIVTTDGIFTNEVIAESFDKLCHLIIDKGTKGLTKEKEPLSQITMVKLEEPPPPPEAVYTIGLVYDFGPDGATFEPPVTLTWSYDPDALPEGVAEEDLVIAYYDEDTGKWIELDSVVDTQTKTISAKVSHFTTFAVFGFPPVVPPVVPPVPPAALTVSHLSVSPSEVYIGERVAISVIVTNTGGKAGSYEVTPKINGVVEATKEVTVNAGLSKEITFTTTRDIAGTYLVDVDGLTGSFTVKEKPALAAFSVTNLSIQPTEVQPKETVTITVLVSNTGGTEGSYTVLLKINSVKEAEKSVTLGAGKSQEVTFSVSKDIVDTYSVDVNGLTGAFTVKKKPEEVLPPKFNWPLIEGIIGGLIAVGLLLYFLVVRRRMAQGK